MKKSSRYLWFWVVLQACAVAVVLGWRIHRAPLPYAPITSTRLDMAAGIKAELDAFSNDCGHYPTTAEGLKALINCPTNISAGRWHGPYFDPPVIPKDLWQHDYVYCWPSNHNNTNGFDLYSCGPDGISKTGGEDPDDINNWDPGSPHGGVFLDSAKGDPQFFGIMAALLIIPMSCGVRLIAAMSSSRIRDSITQNLTAHVIWFVMSVAVFLIFLASAPPVAGK